MLSLNPFSEVRTASPRPSPGSNEVWLVDGVLPGRYQLLVTCAAGFVVPSADVRDAVTNGLWFIDVPRDGPAIARVEANHYTQAGSVDVQCPSCRMVLFMPVNSQSPLLQVSRCFQKKCEPPALAPGEYVLHGIGIGSGDGGEDPISYRDPKTLAALQGGMRISVSKGDRKTIEITELSK
jgi:hypothetical protein